MWHESEQEMIYMLKSIFRLDKDQYARQKTLKHFKRLDLDYYEFETHIFFDDAFTLNSNGQTIVNKYVKCLIKTLDEIAKYFVFI